MNISRISLLLFLSTALFAVECPKEITTLYGTYTLDEPVLCELIESQAVQRLKKINHYGVRAYVIPEHYNRYDHSIGVMLLVRRYGGGLYEQIAALLHDASHAVFSHTIDHVFGKRSKQLYTESKDSHQDSIHEWYLEHTDVPEVLARHGILLHDILHKENEFLRLEQDLPTICADRLEYVLFGGYLECILNEADITQILHDVHFDQDSNLWYFSSIASARKYAYTSLFLTEHIFGSAMNAVINELTAVALRRALTLQYITPQELYFGVDDTVWQGLLNSSDAQIQEYTQAIMQYEQNFTINPDNYTLKVVHKCRGVNPWVKCVSHACVAGDSFLQLSQLDSAFATEYNRVKTVMAAGHLILCPLLEAASESLCNLDLSAMPTYAL